MRSRRAWLLASILAVVGFASLLLAGGLHAHPAAAPMASDRLADFQSFPFDTQGHTYTVYTRGEGPPVLILHELPGLTPQCVRLARILSDAHFQVFMPLLFGKAGVSASATNFWRACFASGYHCFSTTDPGPIAVRMRALSAHLHAEHPHAKMGVLGMCLSGALPIYLLRDDWIAAPIVSQPALPFAWVDRQKSAAGLSQEDLALAKARGVPIFYLRFSGDKVSPEARLQAFKDFFGSPLLRSRTIDSSAGNAFGIQPKAHAVLTSELNLTVPGHPTKLALDKVMAFLNERLR